MRSTKTVILHIGMHKTGTSSIQDSLSAYDDGETRYAQLGVVNHSVPMTTIFSKRPHEYHIWKNQGVSRASVDVLRDEYRARLDAQLADHRHSTLIVSGEDIGILDDDEKRHLFDYFLARNVRLRVVCITRDPAGLAPSALQQHIRGGMAQLAPFHPTYRSCLAYFCDALPPDDVIVRDFQTLVDAHGDIVTAFARTCSLRSDLVEGSARENESLSHDAVRLVFRLNRLPIHAFGRADRMAARALCIDLLATLFPNRSAADRIDGDVTRGLIHLDERELAFLQERFAIDYAAYRSPFDAQRYTAYLNDVSGIDLPRLRQALEEIGVPCCASDTLNSLLMSLYHHLLYRASLKDADADHLRDIAIRIAEGGTAAMEDAVALMALAQRARPHGPMINRKLAEYRAALPT